MPGASGLMPPRLRSLEVLAASILAASMLASCSDEGEPKKNPIGPDEPPAATTRFTGYFGDPEGRSGTIVVIIATASLAPGGPRHAGAARAPARLISATAEIELGPSTTLLLTGWYDSADRSIALGSGTLTFFGRLDTLSGIPAFVAVDNVNVIPNDGWDLGSFVAIPDSSGTVPVQCGAGSDRLGKLGVMGFARADTTLLGIAWVNGGWPVEWFLLQGRLQGSGDVRTVELGAREQGGDSLSVEGTLYMGTRTGGGTFRLLREPPGVSEVGNWDTQPCN